jgi:hypothetical protein
MQAKVIELRRLLAERFPPSRPGNGAVRPDVAATGLDGLDDLLGGGLPRGEFTELIAEGHGTGSGQVLHGWLQHVARSMNVTSTTAGTCWPRSTARTTPW